MSPHNCRQKGDSMYIWMDSMDSMDSILLYYLSDVFREFRLYRIFCIIRKASLGKLQEIDPNSLELSDRESFQQARSTQHCGGQKKMTSYSLLKRVKMNGKYLVGHYNFEIFWNILFFGFRRPCFIDSFTIAWMGWMGFSWFFVAPCGGSEIRHSSPSMYKFIGKGWDKLPTISGLQDFWTINSVMEWSSELFV